MECLWTNSVISLWKLSGLEARRAGLYTEFIRVLLSQNASFPRASAVLWSASEYIIQMRISIVNESKTLYPWALCCLFFYPFNLISSTFLSSETICFHLILPAWFPPFHCTDNHTYEMMVWAWGEEKQWGPQQVKSSHGQSHLKFRNALYFENHA